jgi:hypothetical protein
VNFARYRDVTSYETHTLRVNLRATRDDSKANDRVDRSTMKSAQRCSTCIEIAHPRLDDSSAHGWPAASINEPPPLQDNDSRTFQGLREARLLSPLTPFQSMVREGVGERKACQLFGYPHCTVRVGTAESTSALFVLSRSDCALRFACHAHNCRRCYLRRTGH